MPYIKILIINKKRFIIFAEQYNIGKNNGGKLATKFQFKWAISRTC